MGQTNSSRNKRTIGGGKGETTYKVDDVVVGPAVEGAEEEGEDRPHLSLLQGLVLVVICGGCGWLWVVVGGGRPPTSVVVAGVRCVGVGEDCKQRNQDQRGREIRLRWRGCRTPVFLNIHT